MAPVLASLRPLVGLLGQCADPTAAAADLADRITGGESADAVTGALAGQVTDGRLVGPALRFAGILDVGGRVAPEAPVRAGQVRVLLEAAEEVWAPGWDLVLTVPGFLRPSLPALLAVPGGARPRETAAVLGEVAAAATSRLVVAGPFLHTGFVATLVPAVERVLSSGGEVVVITRALSWSAPDRSSANETAVALLREAGARAGRPVTVRSWEEGSLGIHFKVVVADATLAYLGSANLTPAGAAGNAEAGVLVRGPGVVSLAAWMGLVADELGRRRLPSA